jgi:hypothetical protein
MNVSVEKICFKDDQMMSFVCLAVDLGYSAGQQGQSVKSGRSSPNAVEPLLYDSMSRVGVVPQICIAAPAQTAG